MKLFITFILILTTVLRAQSQDVIHLLSNERIEAKITEVTGSWIKYKRFDNLDGPLFSVPQKEVQKVVYANGTEQTFREPVDKYGRSYEKNMKKYKHRKVGGAIMTSLGGALAIAGIPVMLNNNVYPGMAMMTAGIGVMVPGTIMLGTMNKYRKRAEEIGPSASFSPTVIQTSEFAGANLKTGTAAGISLSFRF